MKVAHADTHVKGSSGLQESKGFGIRTNAHAFRMLSSGLYSDKVGAVLREIACNAVDAHIEAGTPDLPIEVKLPNRIDKQFYVKDWGPGLSHDDLMNLYTTYFASTKQNSNDYTGAFGLGSKSPFSYTDAFVVTSVHGGKKRTYTCHLGDEGVPTVALLTTEAAEADWEHGLMVGFPVKPTDYQEFQNKAQEIYRWFRVAPKVTGATQVVPVKFAFDSPKFARVSQDTPVNHQHGVVMGNVFYPLQQHKLVGLSKLANWMFQFPAVVLRLAIGDVQVAGSREELQYDKKDIALLSQRCEEVVQFVADEVESGVAAFEKATWLDKCKTAGLDSKWTNGYFRWAEFLAEAGKANSAKIAETMQARHLQLPAFTGKRCSFRVLEPTYKGVRHDVIHGGQTAPDKFGDTQPGRLDLKEKTAVYYGKAPHALPRARSLIISGTLERVVLITPDKKKGGDEKDCLGEATEMAKHFPGLATDLIANVPLPPNFVVKGSKSARKKLVNGQLPPLPATQVEALDMRGKEIKVDIAAVPADQQHFMVKRENWAVRVLNTTVEKDRIFYRRDWEKLLLEVGLLQKELGMGSMSYHVNMPVARVRAMDLPKRGWVPTHAFLENWLKDPTVHAELAGIAAKWVPTIDLGSNNTWVYALCRMHNDKKALYDVIKGTFAVPNLDTAITEIARASAKAGANAGKKVPRAIELYTGLGVHFDLPPVTMPAAGTRSYLDPADLDRQILAAHPLMQYHNAHEMEYLAGHFPNKLAEFMKYLQT